MLKTRIYAYFTSTGAFLLVLGIAHLCRHWSKNWQKCAFSARCNSSFRQSLFVLILLNHPPISPFSLNSAKIGPVTSFYWYAPPYVAFHPSHWGRDLFFICAFALWICCIFLKIFFGRFTLTNWWFSSSQLKERFSYTILAQAGPGNSASVRLCMYSYIHVDSLNKRV